MTSYGEISVTGLEHSLVHNCVSLRMQSYSKVFKSQLLLLLAMTLVKGERFIRSEEKPEYTVGKSFSLVQLSSLWNKKNTNLFSFPFKILICLLFSLHQRNGAHL